ncbi:MAG: sigma-54 dependent transcriptional regulator, partial [bacterium]|nr:sigma-54 dependent transcriptional regulator [bacterium]
EVAVQAIRGGAFEYVVKPFDLAQIQTVLERALASRAAKPAETPTEHAAVEGIIGKTPIMQEVFKRIALAAPKEVGVLLTGESGVGKDLAARAIHQYSSRAEGPFVAVNVASLSPTIAESELFGHEKGAFTGADAPRRGLLMEADQGTLFLDEVAEIPLPTQVKLLRSLESGEVTPVGSNRPQKTNFRVISATHRDLPALVAAGVFRHDLYYRLCAFQIELPPLRDRGDDIVALASAFVHQLSSDDNAPVLAEETIAELHRRPWHGNVRELRNAIEHALIVARGGVLLPEHLPDALASPGGVDATSPQQQLNSLVAHWAKQALGVENPHDVYEAFLDVVEPPLVQEALNANKQQVAAAARVLGLHRTTLRKKIEHYKIGE